MKVTHKASFPRLPPACRKPLHLHQARGVIRSQPPEQGTRKMFICVVSPRCIRKRVQPWTTHWASHDVLAVCLLVPLDIRPEPTAKHDILPLTWIFYYVERCNNESARRARPSQTTVWTAHKRKLRHGMSPFLAGLGQRAPPTCHALPCVLPVPDFLRDQGGMAALLLCGKYVVRMLTDSLQKICSHKPLSWQDVNIPRLQTLKFLFSFRRKFVYLRNTSSNELRDFFHSRYIIMKFIHKV